MIHELTDDINSRERSFFVKKWLGFSVLIGGVLTALLSHFNFVTIKNDWNFLGTFLQPIKYLKDHAPEATTSSITLYIAYIIMVCLIYVFKFKSIGTRLIGTQKEKLDTVIFRVIHIFLMMLIGLIPVIGMTILLGGQSSSGENDNLLFGILGSLIAHLFYCGVITSLPMSFFLYLSRYPNKIIKKYNIDLWLIKDDK